MSLYREHLPVDMPTAFMENSHLKSFLINSYWQTTEQAASVSYDPTQHLVYAHTMALLEGRKQVLAELLEHLDRQAGAINLIHKE